MKNEVLTIRLGHRNGHGDRSGWVEGMTQKEAWKAGKGWWVLKASRAVECKLALILSPDLEVIAEAEVLGVRKETVDSERFEIIGELRQSGHEYLGASAQRGTSQNPIAYLAPDAFEFPRPVNADKFTWEAGDLRVVSKSEDPLQAMRDIQNQMKNYQPDKLDEEDQHNERRQD